MTPSCRPNRSVFFSIQKWPPRIAPVAQTCPLKPACEICGLVSAETVNRWLAAINAHDVAGLAALMAADHVFVDPLGNRVRGANSMEASWRAYFALFPDYWIRADHMMSEGDTVLLAGEAGGTTDGSSWRIPAAWRAVILDGSVLEWQVFADNQPVCEILARRRPPENKS
ncbi:MAG: nuclear transport factor 2 family protein [Bryobacteraceae bacterium]